MRATTSSTRRPGRACSARPRRSASCRCICRAASRRARRDLVDITAAAACGRPLHQSHHLGRRHHARRRWARSPTAGLDHVQISIQDSEARHPPITSPAMTGAFARKRALAAEVVRLALPLTVNAVMHRANIDRIGEMVDLALALGATRRRDRARAVLRLGAREPRRPDADPRAGRARRRAGRGRCASATMAASSSTRWCPTITRAIPKPCVGGWGRRSLNVTPCGQGAALPRGGIDPRSRVLVRARSFACRYLDEFAGLQRLPRHRLDEGAVRELRAARDRFRRLPLPGLRAHRRCRGDRPGLSPLAATMRASRTLAAVRTDAAYAYRHQTTVIRGRRRRETTSRDPDANF